MNHPQVKLLYDFLNEQIAEGNLIEKLAKNIDYTGLVHIADVPDATFPVPARFTTKTSIASCASSTTIAWLQWSSSRPEIPLKICAGRVSKHCEPAPDVSKQLDRAIPPKHGKGCDERRAGTWQLSIGPNVRQLKAYPTAEAAHGFLKIRACPSRLFLKISIGTTIEEIIEQYDVTREQFQAVLEFAARSLDAPPSPY